MFLDSVPDNAPDNARGIVFAEDEAGYLAGVVAAGFTTSKKVAVAAGPPIPAVVRFSTGFLRGVKLVCPSCSVLHEYLINFGDLELGRQAAARMFY
jgi:basic membrane lipoprotein Med (substrate-binding protein (PBP1-ABC) superfamily)